MTNIEKWVENNPDGFQRAMDEAHDSYLDVWDFKGNNWNASESERSNVIESLPNDPDAIHEQKYALLQTLSDSEYEARDAIMAVRDNLNLAREMEEFGFEGDGYKEGLRASSENALEGKTELSINDIAQKYNMSDSPIVVEQTQEPIQQLSDIEPSMNVTAPQPFSP